MPTKVSKKEFERFMDTDISFGEYQSLIDLDNCIEINKLYDTINKKFNIVKKD